MTLAISLDVEQFRLDSEKPPRATISGIQTPYFTYAQGYIKLADWTYLHCVNGVNVVSPPNRSKKACPVEVRELIGDASQWTWDAAKVDALNDGETDKGLYMFRHTGEGFDGLVRDLDLDPVLCSIQGKATSITLSCGISLQNYSDVTSHNYLDTSVPHAILLGYAGQGQIRELGEVPIINGYFQYEVGDTAMIELRDGIVRYYLIKPDGSMTLIRTTRTKLTSAPKAEVMLYFDGSELRNVLICDNGMASTSIETIGVLENFQDWFNDFFVTSTADQIQMADNNPQFTFPNHKQRLRTLTANLNMRQKEDRDDFLAFFNFHGIETPFLFVDNAHKDADGDPTIFWARFASAFGDKARSSCLSAHAATIIEDYRNDYIPKLLDPSPPTIPFINVMQPGDVTGQIFMDITISTDNIVKYQWKMKHLIGGAYGDPVDAYFPTIYTQILVGGLVSGDTYYAQIRAIDYAGRVSDWSIEESGTAL